MKSITNNLDFTGGKGSYFDFWHTHIDWEIEGNKSWELRQSFLEKLITEFENVKIELKKYPHNFQTWIVIDENDSGEDGIYIHTKNPNSDNFPLKIQNSKSFTCKNKRLKQFITNTKLNVIEIVYDDGKGYYLFDEKIGEPLTF